MPTDPPRVVIVGGGLSGLSLAFRLRELLPAAHLTVIEKQSRVGGHIGTLARDGFRVESGPNGIFDAKPSTLQLCRDLGLGDRLIAASEGSRKNRYLFRNGKLRPLPGSLWSFVSSSVLSWRAKLAILTEKYRRRSADVPSEESVAAFARRRAGKEVADVLADAAVTGVHAGDPELLSVAAAFPRLVQFEREHGSVMRGFSVAARQRRRDALARGETPRPLQMWSFREGLQVLVDALRDQLRNSLVAGVGIRHIERRPDGWVVRGDGRDTWETGALVLTTRAHEQADQVEQLDATLASEMRAIPYNRIAVVALGYRRSDVSRHDLDGFGYIAPQNTHRDVLGVQWCSSIYPDRAPADMLLWRALCGGWHRREMVEWPEDRLVDAVRGELRLAMGVTAAPAFVHVTRFPAAIPQYLVGHLERVKRIEARVAAFPGLFVGGNAYHGVAMNDCTEQAVVLAGRVAAYLAR